MVRSPRSGASFLDLGDFQGQQASAFARTLATLRHWNVPRCNELEPGPRQLAAVTVPQQET